MPVPPFGMGWLSRSPLSAESLPAFFAVWSRPSGAMTAIPAESYPRYSKRFSPPRSTSRLLSVPTYPTIPHMHPILAWADTLDLTPMAEHGAAQGGTTGNGDSSPFVELSRSDWAELAQSTRLPLKETEIVQLRGLGDPLDMREVEEVYLPLSRLLNLYVGGAKQLHRVTSQFLGERAASTPFVIGVAGSVAVGKSTIARLLRELLSRWDDTPRVELVTTDGFLLPNAELARRGLMERKGFPESYDRRVPAAVRDRGQERSPRGARALLLAPQLRHRARRRDRACAAPTC